MLELKSIRPGTLNCDYQNLSSLSHTRGCLVKTKTKEKRGYLVACICYEHYQTKHIIMSRN